MVELKGRRSTRRHTYSLRWHQWIGCFGGRPLDTHRRSRRHLVNSGFSAAEESFLITEGDRGKIVALELLQRMGLVRSQCGQRI